MMGYWIVAGLYLLTGILYTRMYYIWRYRHPENPWRVYFKHYAVRDSRDWKM